MFKTMGIKNMGFFSKTMLLCSFIDEQLIIKTLMIVALFILFDLQSC